jgi:hypothetical protein
MTIEQVEKIAKKMFSVIKPEGVIEIDFRFYSYFKNEFYLSLNYIVPDGSEYMKISRKEDPRNNWNRVIKKTLESYLDIRVIINNTGLTTESFYKQQKERERYG